MSYHQPTVTTKHSSQSRVDPSHQWIDSEGFLSLPPPAYFLSLLPILLIFSSVNYPLSPLDLQPTLRNPLKSHCEYADPNSRFTSSSPLPLLLSPSPPPPLSRSPSNPKIQSNSSSHMFLELFSPFPLPIPDFWPLIGLYPPSDPSDSPILPSLFTRRPLVTNDYREGSLPPSLALYYRDLYRNEKR